MAEMINKKPVQKDPVRIGKKADIKVKAKRPVLLGHHDGEDAVRVEEDEICFVTEADFKRHEHILEKLALVALLFALLLLGGKSAQAQSYSANVALPTNSYYYNTNISTSTGSISGGVMNSNTVAAATTNTAMCLTPVGLTRYDSCAVEITATNATANATNTVWTYACDDGWNADTNHPLQTNSLVTSSTNGILQFLLPNTVLGSHGYIQFGMGNQTGGNVFTNILIQVFVKPQKSG